MIHLHPQTELVLSHLIVVGHISNVEANAVHGIRSVSSRISELKKAGYKIDKTTKHDMTGQRYTSYSLAKTNFILR